MAALLMVGQKSESQIVERVSGIEPPLLPWQGSVINHYTTPAINYNYLKCAAGQNRTDDPTIFSRLLYP